MKDLVRRGITWMAMAAAVEACGGGGEKPAPVPQEFTAAMLEGKTFYREQVTAPGQRKVLITFSSPTNVTLWQEQVGGVAEVPGTWSIDSSGKLVLQAGPGHATVTLLADAATWLDVSADDGTGPVPERLFKTIPFGATLPDRFAVADRDLSGATRLAGVAAFEAGTVVSTDGFGEGSGPWSGNPDGSVTLADKPNERTLVYLRADSSVSSPKSLHIVGRVHDSATSAFLKIADAVLTETPAKSGFTAPMVEGKVLYREDTGAGNRSIIRYAAGGIREEWYQDAAFVLERVGTWTLAVAPLSGSLVALPAQGMSEVAAMLVEDRPTSWNLLVNTGTGIYPATLWKTVAATAAEWPALWSVVERGVYGTVVATYPITLYANGTGIDPDAQQFTWVVQGDGSILVSWPDTDTITFYERATSAPPNLFELVGIRATGSTYTGLLVQTYTK